MLWKIVLGTYAYFRIAIRVIKHLRRGLRGDAQLVEAGCSKGAAPRGGATGRAATAHSQSMRPALLMGAAHPGAAAVWTVHDAQHVDRRSSGAPGWRRRALGRRGAAAADACAPGRAARSLAPPRLLAADGAGRSAQARFRSAALPAAAAALDAAPQARPSQRRRCRPSVTVGLGLPRPRPASRDAGAGRARQPVLLGGAAPRRARARRGGGGGVPASPRAAAGRVGPRWRRRCQRRRRWRW